MLLLALETSFDETAVALLDLEKFRSADRGAEALRANLISSQLEHAAYGGVVPELAARIHITNLPMLIERICEAAGIGANEIAACAVTQGPGLKGALLVGLNFAKGFAWSRGIPCVPVNHLEAHLWAYELEKRHPSNEPFVALLVSGGHTTLVAADSFRRYRQIAVTRDDAAGEAFDKIATILEQPYPGGAALSRLAVGGDQLRFHFQTAMAGDRTSFSYSGLKTAAVRLSEQLKKSGEWEIPQIRSDFAASVEYSIVQPLVEKSLFALDEIRPKRFVVSGGVAANRLLRERFAVELAQRGIPLEIPAPEYCTDNAAMIAVVGALSLEAFGADSFRSVPSYDALPRWPLEQLSQESNISGPL